MKITPPKSFSIPEGTQPGDYFKSLDQWKLLKNGDIELCEIDGCDVTTDKAEEDMEGMNVPQRAEYQMAQMKGQNAGPGY